MKIESTEALRYIRTCIEPNVDTAMSTITRYDAGIAAKIAFQEGQSNPKIKQLEWEHGLDNRLLSKTLTGDYTIAPIKNGYQLSLYNKNEYYWLKYYVNTIDEAKQFAQSDFEACVKECLITE